MNDTYLKTDVRGWFHAVREQMSLNAEHDRLALRMKEAEECTRVACNGLAKYVNKDKPQRYIKVENGIIASIEFVGADVAPYARCIFYEALP